MQATCTFTCTAKTRMRACGGRFRGPACTVWGGARCNCPYRLHPIQLHPLPGGKIQAAGNPPSPPHPRHPQGTASTHRLQSIHSQARAVTRQRRADSRRHRHRHGQPSNAHATELSPMTENLTKQTRCKPYGSMARRPHPSKESVREDSKGLVWSGWAMRFWDKFLSRPQKTNECLTSNQTTV